jgi:macrolide transport system ATP-binding/permease protein
MHVSGRVKVPILDVSSGDKLLLTGGNGSGKSSLLAVLAGRLRPTGGSVQVAAGRIGLLEQDVVFDDPSASALATFADAIEAAAGYDDPDDAAAEQLIGLGLLRPREIGSPVGALSVGQRRRLALAILIASLPDLVLLDEPTNHISLALAAELEDALGASPGTVVVASHDRWLRQRWEGPSYPM